MIQENIKEIFIDEAGRLCLKPEKETFAMIYRSATDVHWDSKENFLYSPKPKEWTYLDWYKHIISTIFTECNSRLKISSLTSWESIPNDLKEDIIAFDNSDFEEWTSSLTSK